MKKVHSLTYWAYVLRLWREEESAPWRATLESVHTGERHSFADIEKLFAFLMEMTGATVLPPDPETKKHAL